MGTTINTQSGLLTESAIARDRQCSQPDEIDMQMSRRNNTVTLSYRVTPERAAVIREAIQAASKFTDNDPGMALRLICSNWMAREQEIADIGKGVNRP